ncbi:MAG: hypothetical protein ACD_58C00071G0011 [uncultured bacterium]|nr:MAG: hypothetical protein ACD_58C00071G0011 [uncultured bacterium]
MKIFSPNFKDQEKLPIKYTCDGQGVLPELSWQDYPPETKSFVLVVEDPDAPAGIFVHLLAINIPVSVIKLAEGATEVPQAQMVPNTSGRTNYIPACPPSGTHRYIFKVFALNIDKIQGVNTTNYLSIIKPHVIDQAEITTYYQRL